MQNGAYGSVAEARMLKHVSKNNPMPVKSGTFSDGVPFAKTPKLEWCEKAWSYGALLAALPTLPNSCVAVKEHFAG